MAPNSSSKPQEGAPAGSASPWSRPKACLPAPECRFPRPVASGLESGATNQPRPPELSTSPAVFARSTALCRPTPCLPTPAHDISFDLEQAASETVTPRSGATDRARTPSRGGFFDRLGPARSCEPSPGPSKSRHLNAADPPRRPVDGGVDDPHQFPGPGAIGTNAIHDLTGAERSASTANPAVERQLPKSLEGGPSPGADLPKTPRQGSCWHVARGDEAMRYTAKA